MVVDKGWSGRQSAECLVTRLSLPSHDEIPVPVVTLSAYSHTYRYVVQT